MFRKCCVLGCSSERQDVKLHRMPVDVDKRNMWVKAISAGQANNFQHKSEDINKLHVCHKHFERKYVTENLRLLNTACPTLFSSEDIERGTPSISFAEIETSHVKGDHNYPAKLHCDHSYAKPEFKLKIIETSASSPQQSTATSLRVAAVRERKDTGNTETAMLNLQDSSSAILLVSPAEKNTEHSGAIDSQKSAVTKRSEADPVTKDIAHTGTPRRLMTCRKKLFNYHSLSPKCKELYKQYRQARRQTNYRKRIKMALKFSKSESFQKLTKDMNTLTKKILWMQVKLCTKNKKARRFTTEEKIIALSILKQSPKCYRFLQKIFILPSKSTLNKLVEGLQMEAGINSAVFSTLQQQVSSWDKNKKLCTIIFDEMSLSPGLTYAKNSDKIHGFVELSSKTRNFADHALAFIIKGAVHKWKQPIAFYFSEGAASAQHVKSIIQDIVGAVSATGLIPVALVSDQGSSFQSAYRSLQDDTRRDQIKSDRETDGTIELHGHKLSIIYDPPHLLKGVRNNFLTKDIDMSGKRCCWQDIVDVYTTDCRHAEMRLLHKLNDEHIIPKKINKMKVKNCVRVFSKTVAAALTYTAAFSHYANGSPVSSTLKNTASLISFLDDLFDSVNGASVSPKVTKGKILRKAATINSHHEAFWTNAIVTISKITFIDEAGKLKSVPSLKNWITTLKSYLRLWQLLKSNNINIMRTRYYNSDAIENFFGQVRSYNCRNNDPTCSAFSQTFKSLLITGFIKFHHSSFSCEEDLSKQIININELFHQFRLHKQSPEVQNVNTIRNHNDNIQEQVARERLNVNSRAYTAGWVIRKLLAKYNCEACRNDFTSDEKSNIHKWITQKEYKSMKENKLTYPSEYAVRSFGNIIKESNEYLESNAHCNSILSSISQRVIAKYSFDFAKCDIHRAHSIEFFIDTSIRLCIFNWCNIINKILKGTDVLRLEGRQLPTMQLNALLKFKKRFKNK